MGGLGGLVAYDCECFRHDWCVCFREVAPPEGEPRTWGFQTGQNQDLLDFMGVIKQDHTLAGFNSKHYDRGIVSALCLGASPEEAHDLNDFIIKDGNNYWDWPGFGGQRYWYPDTDLMDDTMMGTSLKSVESQMGWPIRESTVPFDIDRALTDAEMAEVLRYCAYDVESTARLAVLRKDYLETKTRLGTMAGLEGWKALGMTNGRLTAEYLRADAEGTTEEREADERDYTWPLLDSFPIPDAAAAFFGRGKDPNVAYDELFSSSLDLNVGGCPVTLAFGGIHGAVPRSMWETDSEHVIANWDVASLYPSLIIGYGLMSRHCPEPKRYEDTYHARLEAKRTGDKALSDALKLVLNTTYGVMRQRFSKLYDPRMARSVCVSGQVVMLGLACRLVRDTPSLELIQLNTDGIMFRVAKTDAEATNDIIREWMDATGLVLERDDLSKVAQRDVNNYAARFTDGHDKTKGGTLARGVKSGGGWGVSNDARVVAEAIHHAILDGTPPSETVAADDDPTDYQITAKASHKYSRVYQLGGRDVYDEVDRQQCNRVFATTYDGLGTLYKVKAETGGVAKIASLPEHCLVANEKNPDIKDIDKAWYVALAERRVAEFLPAKEKDMTETIKNETTENETAPKTAPRKRTATKKVETEAVTNPHDLNVYQKLALARTTVLHKGIKKTGKNMFLEFTYYSLEDIVPVAEETFQDLGLVLVVTNLGYTYSKESPKNYGFEVVNADEPSERIAFQGAYDPMDVIVSNAGKNATNPCQAAGSSITYYRRYFWMIALDLVEADAIDSNIGNPKAGQGTGETPAKAVAAPVAAQRSHKAHATPTERKASADAQTEGNAAPKLLLNSLKRNVAALHKAKPDDEKATKLAKLCMDKTEKFTTGTTKTVETLIAAVTERMDA